MIHIIGNSHVNTFSNLPFLAKKENNSKHFISHCIGATTARYMYSVSKNKIDDALRHVNINDDYIIPLAGEVDCRFHIPLQADRKKISDIKMVDIFMDGYMEVYSYLQSLGYKLISFGCHPSTTEEHNLENIRRPICGTMKRRNGISRYWNKRLEEESDKRSIPYFDIYKYLVDNNNVTNMDYFIDYCHLNGDMVHQFILTELKTILDI